MTTASLSELEQSISTIKELCEHQQDAIVWSTPMYSENDPASKEIIDFRVLYANPRTTDLTQLPPELMLNKCIKADRVPDPSISDIIFEQSLQVYNTGQPLEYSYYSEGFNKYVSLFRIKVRDGVLTTVRNTTAQHKANFEKEKQARLLDSLVDNSPYGISVYEAVRDENGEITDFKMKLVNKKAAEITAFSIDHLQRHTVKQLMQERGHSQFFDVITNVVNTGKSQYLEYYSQMRNMWIGFSIVKFQDGYLLNYIDITEPKRFEEEARKNAQELDLLFNSSVSAVYAADVVKNEAGKVTDLVFRRVNDTFRRMFDLQGQEVAGMLLSHINEHDGHAAFFNIVENVLSTGEHAKHQLQYLNPERWFEFSIVRLDASTVAVTLNDITAAKISGLEIERQRNLLESILRQIPNGLTIMKAIRDEQRNMVDAISVLANEACEKLNGIPNNVMLANNVSTLDPSAVASPLFRKANDLSIGETYRTEFLLEKTQKWIELGVARMDEDHFINVMTDITPLKIAHDEQEKSLHELRAANQNLEHFAHALSHDMKEPVRKVRLYVDQIKQGYSGTLGEKGLKYVERLDAAATRMTMLIDGLLAYAQTNQSNLQFETVDLNDVVQEVIDDLEFTIIDTSASITTDKLPVISGSKVQLQQVFQNLLGNALKYHQPDTAPKVKVAYKQVDSKKLKIPFKQHERPSLFHVIEIIDNGIGFDDKYSESIFQVFTRLHGKGEYSGSGLGLSIVKKVIENHGGYIFASSVVGKGSVFTIAFPAE